MFRIARANLWHHTAFAEKISACPNLTLETFDRMDAPREWIKWVRPQTCNVEWQVD